MKSMKNTKSLYYEGRLGQEEQEEHEERSMRGCLTWREADFRWCGTREAQRERERLWRAS